MPCFPLARFPDDSASLWILLAAAVGIATISKYVTTFGKSASHLSKSGFEEADAKLQ